MARETVVSLVDDLDGSPGDETVVLGWGGREYEIDLSVDNVKRLTDFLTPFLDVARPVRRPRGARMPAVGGKSAARKDRSDNTAMREWAREHGYAVSDRGRVAHAIRDAYLAETKGVAPMGQPAE